MELILCPACGREPIIENHAVKCTFCRHRTISYQDDFQAMEAWNLAAEAIENNASSVARAMTIMTKEEQEISLIKSRYKLLLDILEYHAKNNIAFETFIKRLPKEFKVIDYCVQRLKKKIAEFTNESN